ncbi:MAG TPA: ShlB/FhaC/HecB family hemolysin secretion/activation protein [Azospira sp.]|nr:ShlB/FhaC/HecB family hemolysin secretion/activation protein [Azospira sp.]HNN08429.1 ShlB/FhaC/HecB family hemolysin secretion/activation protein [Azospira sp.]
MLHPVKHPGRQRPRRRTAWLLGLGCVLAVANAHAQGRFSSPPEPKFSIKRFVVDGENPLSDGDTDAILAGFTGEQQGVARLQQAARALETELKARGYGFYRVTLPPQDVVDTVTLKLIMFRVGKIEIQEQQYYSEANIRASFPSLREDESPNARAVARNLAMVNDHPGKQATVTLTESEMRDAIDVAIKVKDSDPLVLFSALQNNGSDSTGKWRLSVGMQNSNLFDRDQQLTLSYTTSPDEHHKDVRQYGGHWVVPFYDLASTLSTYVVYSDVNSGRVAGFFDVAGRGTFGGARWTYRLLPVGDASQTVSLALDYKQYQNDVLFNGANQGTDVSALPVTVAYAGDWRQGWGKLDWGLDYAFNTPSGKDSSSDNYAANRSGASRQWDAWRALANLNWQADDGWGLQARWRGQYSGNPLIPGEQFGAGGAYTVRGYQEREISGDSGYVANLEVWSKPYAEQVRFLAFLDTGQIRINDAADGQRDKHRISSVGVGGRWQPHKNVGVVLDVGHALRDAVTTHAGDWFGHALLTVRF